MRCRVIAKNIHLQIKRYYPVSNISRTREAYIMELYHPDNFEVTLTNSTSLQYLSICEVCGSYQCPFCPFYNGSTNIQQFKFLYAIILVIVVFWLK